MQWEVMEVCKQVRELVGYKLAQEEEQEREEEEVHILVLKEVADIQVEEVEEGVDKQVKVVDTQELEEVGHRWEKEETHILEEEQEVHKVQSKQGECQGYTVLGENI